ncbi:hypothetical protein K443DRAFT_670999 [Laccaria amethystina LaAM-08-1]|uniref:Rho1 guanine nucleotide exchange factor 1 n=1 Tax=Laccaria amethystina LaAM-08-1 TaxID=1095629 RepID=A0A0C9Y8L4_9AGAR|nr:hypothetical protein K443DRAFT_670999 [Laccaria amethystina LaAM-08-1]
MQHNVDGADGHHRPHVSLAVGGHLPFGSRNPMHPSPARFPAYTFDLSPPAYDGDLPNPLDTQHASSTLLENARPPMANERHHRPSSRSTSFSVIGTPSIAFPEPQIYRSVSHKQSSRESTLQPPSTSRPPNHHFTQSDLGPTRSIGMHQDPSVASFRSTASSYYQNNDDYNYTSPTNEFFADDTDDITRELSDFTLNSEEGLRRFQNGELAEADQEWHRLVPNEARDALGKKEVQRQSVLFEIFKAEREYVADLEAVEEVFIAGLMKASPPIIPESQLSGFIHEVFGNLNQILTYHQAMLAALFARQRDQHPLIQSVADIVLDTTLKSDFRSAYETYIKHYPLSESHHRKQLKKNHAYAAFIQSVSTDQRIRKRDLITFLSRPVTRLPRLNLLLEQTLKLTDEMHDHPDLETLPIILGILKDCIKSTQPGIEAAESKVKFWELCESLVYQKGEIIDMDLYDESRTFVYSGPVSRRARSETGFSSGGWTELVAALLDNFFVLTREEKRPSGSVKRLIMSRPIPLSFLRLGTFDSAPETRRERAEDGGLLDSLRYQTVTLYPFTVYHASNRSTRRYTLYVTTEALRKRWQSVLVETIGVFKVRQDSNMWFDPQKVSDNFFRVPGRRSEPAVRTSGRINSGVPFNYGGRKFIVVGCASGIYLAHHGTEQFRKVLNNVNPASISALQTLGNKMFNKLVVHADASVYSYSLETIVRVGLGHAHPQTIEVVAERIGGSDNNILFCKHLQIGARLLLVYASKKRLSTTLNLHVLEAIDTSKVMPSPTRTAATSIVSYRPYGDPGYVPKDAYDVVGLVKTIGICTNDGIVTVDPTNLALSDVAVVPDLQGASNNPPVAALKVNLEGAKPLGLLRVDANELLVVYDVLGCYINRRGQPTRQSGYIKWETKATSYAHRQGHVLLFSPEFIEIRSAINGRIVQVIEGNDIRLLFSGPMTSKDDPVMFAMRGDKDDGGGVSEKIVELKETSEIAPVTPLSASVPVMWDEWDM